SADRTDSLIRRMVEHAFNQGALAVVDELLAPDGVTHLPSWGMPHTREGLKQLIAMFRSAFPDLQCTVEDEISAGESCGALDDARHAPTHRRRMAVCRLLGGKSRTGCPSGRHVHRRDHPDLHCARRPPLWRAHSVCSRQAPAAAPKPGGRPDL